jgi:polyisoprenoid-binding protein YceI
MKQIALAALLLTCSSVTFAQEVLLTRTGFIGFTSLTPLEKIEGRTHSAASALDKQSGQLEFSVLIKSFAFQKALMQEHFNENYLESDKYPKAQFKGNIEDVSKVKFNQPGDYTVTVSGELMLHGQTKRISTQAIFKVTPEGINATSEFTILLEDYKIKIPALVKDKISKTVQINIQLQYEAI